MIIVKNLKKTYNGVPAVDGIDFAVEKGEIFGFLGPNGAGKTSTINMMIGLSRPTDGSIIINGIDIRKNLKKAQAVMGVVPDESNLYNELNGFENLCFCASLYGMRQAERKARAQWLLEQFCLHEAGDLPFRAYSKGMKRKLTIAAALIHSPSILFLDEPTSGIDVESARQIRKMILNLKNSGTTVFITTHYIEEAERICDRLAFIVKGKIIAEGSVSEFIESVSSGHVIRLVINQNAKSVIPDLQSRFTRCFVEADSDHSLVIRSEQRLPLSPVISYLHEKGIDVYEAKELLPSLEDAFVQLTGISSVQFNREKES